MALREVIDDGDVLVGHSMGGFAISLAADEVPDKIARLVYLSAAVPIEGASMGEATHQNTVNDWPDVVGMPYEEFTAMVELPEQGLCVQMTSAEAAAKIFSHDCTPEDQAWAFEHLTPLPIAPALEPFHIPRFWGAPIPRDFIVCTDDHSHPVAMDNEFMRRLGLTTALQHHLVALAVHQPARRTGEAARRLRAGRLVLSGPPDGRRGSDSTRRVIPWEACSSSCCCSCCGRWWRSRCSSRWSRGSGCSTRSP